MEVKRLNTILNLDVSYTTCTQNLTNKQMRYKRIPERLNVSTSEMYILNLHNTLADWYLQSFYL